MRQERCDVLVVGAGPVGLVASIDLAQRGVDVMVVDRRETFDPLTVRCNHIAARTMETFRRLGLAEDVRAAGFRDDFPHNVAIRLTGTGEEMARIRIPGRKGRRTGERGPDTDWPTPEPPHRMNQIFLEPVMQAHAERTDGLRLNLGHDVTDLREQEDSVTATVRTADDEAHEIVCQYLIGCDGGSSLVRKRMGARLTGDEVVQRVQSSFIHAPGLTAAMRGGEAWSMLCINPRRSGTIYTIDNDDRFLVHNYLRPGEDDFEAVDRDACLRTILGVGEDFRYTMLRVEDWIGRRLVADKIREGRVFLAGDAAHIWVPMGGYGMNAGIADAACLSWQVAARLAGWGGPVMLDAYSAERLPITEQVSHFAMRTAETMIRNRAAVPPDLEDDTPEGAAARAKFGRNSRDLNVPQYCCAGLNFGYFYDRSPIIVHDGDPAPAYSMGEYTPSTVPGCRMPHVFLPDGASLYDRLGPDYTLVRVGGGNGGETLKRKADAAGVPMKVIDVPPSPEHDHALILVRPDQHIAWRGNADPDDPRAVIATISGHV